jgi:hypothetical protein
MDVGVYWSPAVLEHKLERRGLPGHHEEVWNCRHLPKGLGIDASGDRLVIASEHRWVGAFRLATDVLFNPNDPSCPYALIFEVGSWTVLPSPQPCKPFRGWKYLSGPCAASASSADSDLEPPSTDGRDHRR